MTELYEGRLQQYVYDSETKHKMEMDEIDERKSNQIMKLIKEHEESLADIRNYYTDIVQNNLTLIGSLKQQMEELSVQLEKSEHQLKKVYKHFILYLSNHLKLFLFIFLVVYVSVFFHPWIVIYVVENIFRVFNDHEWVICCLVQLGHSRKSKVGKTIA